MTAATKQEIAGKIHGLDSDLSKKKQVVETTCESHEKTSMGNFKRFRGSYPLENFYFPGISFDNNLSAEGRKGSGRPADNLTQP